MRCQNCKENKPTNKFPNDYKICFGCLIGGLKEKPCRECGISKAKSKFPKAGGLTCLSCISRSPKMVKKMREYQKNRYEDPKVRKELLRKKSEYRKKLTKAGYYKKYDQSTPRRWLAAKMRGARYKAVKNNMQYDLTTEFLFSLWEKQSGKCVLSGVFMTHCRNDPKSASIDRIDSSKGYTKDNIQLICSLMNLGKNKHKNKLIVEFIDEIRRVC